MRIFQRAFPLALLFMALTGVIAGCQQGEANNSEAENKMRAAYQKKGYSLNDVPPSQRAMVEGMMRAGKSGQVPTPPSPAAKPPAR